MIEFHDQQGRRLHEEFQEWRRSHPGSYYLNFTTSGRAQLHAVPCYHVGGIDWDGYVEREGREQLQSATANRKVCGDRPDELLLWASQECLIVSQCAHCIKENLGIPSDTVKTAPLQRDAARELYDNIDDNDVALAVEGISREMMVTVKSRNGGLRRAALHSANGVCEACGTDYSSFLEGLGRHVLQVHHRQQLGLATEPQLNCVEDLAVLCANCHQMIHADTSNALPVEELRRRFLASRG
jgi:hypothetical protein